MSGKPAATSDEVAEAPEKTRIVFIDIGRPIAAFLVFYVHLTDWVRENGDSAPYLDFINKFTSDPMHMATQSIGQLGVPFFFLVSGFVITPLAVRQGHYRFSIGRFLRIYLPLGFALILTSLALVAGMDLQHTHQSQELTPWTMFTNWTLANYLIPPQVILMPVVWTMIIEVMFYIMVFCLLPVLRRSMWLAISIELVFIFAVLLTRNLLGDSWFLFAVNVSYLPAIIIGQIFWAVTTKRLPLWQGGVFAGLCWMLYVFADIIDVGRIDSSYNLALAFAAICFLMGLLAEPKLRQRRIWTALSERTYSIYLLHTLCLYVVFDLLRPAVPLWLALIILIVVTALVVEVSYRFVERPSHALARRLSQLARPKRRSEPEPEAAEEAPEGPDSLDHQDDLREAEASSAARTRRVVVPASRTSAAVLASEITAELTGLPINRPPREPRVPREPLRPRQQPPPGGEHRRVPPQPQTQAQRPRHAPARPGDSPNGRRTDSRPESRPAERRPDGRHADGRPAENGRTSGKLSGDIAGGAGARADGRPPRGQNGHPPRGHVRRPAPGDPADGNPPDAPNGRPRPPRPPRAGQPSPPPQPSQPSQAPQPSSALPGT